MAGDGPLRVIAWIAASVQTLYRNPSMYILVINYFRAKLESMTPHQNPNCTRNFLTSDLHVPWPSHNTSISLVQEPLIPISMGPMKYLYEDMLCQRIDYEILRRQSKRTLNVFFQLYCIAFNFAYQSLTFASVFNFMVHR